MYQCHPAPVGIQILLLMWVKSHTNNIQKGLYMEACWIRGFSFFFFFKRGKMEKLQARRNPTSFPSIFHFSTSILLLSSAPTQRRSAGIARQGEGSRRVNLGALLCNTWRDSIWGTAGLHACGWIERLAGYQNPRIESRGRGCHKHNRRIIAQDEEEQDSRSLNFDCLRYSKQGQRRCTPGLCASTAAR